MRFLVLFGLFFLLLPCLSRAEIAAPSMDPKARALAVELVHMLRTDVGIKQGLSGMSDSILALLLRDNPSQRNETKEIFRVSLEKTFFAHLDEFEANAISLYLQQYTADELQQILDFYKTPVGQKMTKTMSDTARKSVEVNLPVFQRAIQEAALETAVTLKRKGLKVPKELGL